MIAAAEPDLFTVEDAANIAVSRLDCDRSSLMVESLVGGVSAVIFLVSDGSGKRYVIKQARAVLDVPDLWTADPGRALFEARALTVMGTLVPGQVPQVVSVLPEEHAIVLSAAPANWVNFKSALLEGTARASASAEIAMTLASVHNGTRSDAEIRDVFDRREEVEALRIEPWFEAAAEKNPQLVDLMDEAATLLRGAGKCLVHGDVTPKNVLCSSTGTGSWLLDPEVAHFGQPEFDTAMWCSHLLLKIHRKQSAEQRKLVGTALSDFITTYSAEVQDSLLNQENLGLLISAVCQARLFGKSRVEYRDDINRDALFGDLASIINSRTAATVTLERIGSDV